MLKFILNTTLCFCPAAAAANAIAVWQFVYRLFETTKQIAPKHFRRFFAPRKIRHYKKYATAKNKYYIKKFNNPKYMRDIKYTLQRIPYLLKLYNE